MFAGQQRALAQGVRFATAMEMGMALLARHYAAAADAAAVAVCTAFAVCSFAAAGILHLLPPQSHQSRTHCWAAAAAEG